MHQVTSRHNHRVKLASSLRSKQKRDRHGLFLIEGTRELERAVEANVRLEFILVNESSRATQNHSGLLERIVSTSDPDLVFVDEDILQRVCYRGTSSTIVAIAKQFSLSLSNLTVRDKSFFLVAVGLEKPGNLGSILRSADATGADGVIVCDQVTDVFNPNVVRSSLGTLFCVPVACTKSEELLDWSKHHELNVVVSSPTANKSYVRADFTKSTAIVVGSESLGLGDEWFEETTESVCLPQLGQADSVNAAIAASVMMFEARRQRSVAASGD